MRVTMLCAAIALSLAISADVTTQPAAASAAHDLLRATAPGAFSVRYLPDRALISTSASEPFRLSIHLPRPPLWAYLNGKPFAVDAVTWDETGRMATVALEAGTHSAEIGWAGTGERPAPGQTIPLLVGGTRIAQLPVSFTFDRLEAQGTVKLPLGVARVWLDGCPQDEAPPAVVRLGNDSVSEWRRVRDRWQGRGHVITSGESLVSLVYSGNGLLTSPIVAVEIEPLSIAADPVKVDAMPDTGILIEAEDFVAQGNGDVKISEGEHVDQHGGKSIYTFTGDGHWLEWEFTVPQDGKYDLFARVATGEAMSFREITVDGEFPAPGYRLVRFPGTGGWAHSPGEWWAMHVAGASDALPALDLKAGTHRLRVTGVFQYHLNVDYFVLRRR
ncbi:MAG: carbohydrate-binding protein [Armatimonadetes bacterium]|nr:carbohydrate-binding protein [Armatimonadota bacterium]